MNSTGTEDDLWQRQSNFTVKVGLELLVKGCVWGATSKHNHSLCSSDLEGRYYTNQQVYMAEVLDSTIYRIRSERSELDVGAGHIPRALKDYTASADGECTQQPTTSLYSASNRYTAYKIYPAQRSQSNTVNCGPIEDDVGANPTSRLQLGSRKRGPQLQRGKRAKRQE